jgi:ribulose 1,5-bisphosphate carboxylase large subunit-like protein
LVEVVDDLHVSREEVLHERDRPLLESLIKGKTGSRSQRSFRRPRTEEDW